MPPSNKGKKAAIFRYHVAPKEEKTSTNRRYIHYSSKSGLISTSATSVTTPLVMHKANERIDIQPEGLQVGINSMDSTEEDNGDDDEMSIDQAYLDHTEEHGIEVAEGVKRVRFKGV